MMMALGFSRFISTGGMFRGCSNRIIYPSSSSSLISERIKRVESELLPALALKDLPIPKSKLLEKMQQYEIPAVSIAVINNGEIEWAKSYGTLKVNTDREALVTSLFQAGSISKPLSAFGALTLVQEGKLDLNGNINEKLTRWKAPSNEITLKHILSHTSGISVMGFDGYGAHEKIPTLQEILAGSPPANNPPIGLEFKPGTCLKYSSGGYTVLQQLVEDTVNRSFSDFMHDKVFKPLKMTNSTMNLKADFIERIATGHSKEPIIGEYKRYPESAAVGLWSTPIDISKWLIHVQNSLTSRQNSILNQERVEQMITRVVDPYGLGIVVNGSGNNTEISHKGKTGGFACGFVGYPYLKKGIVVMMNSDSSGFCVVDDITRAVSKVYQWPFNKTEIKSTIDLSSADLNCAGQYGTGSKSYDLFVKKINKELFIEYGADTTPYKLHKELENKFFITETGDIISFNEDGNSAKLLTIVMQTGQEFKLNKIA